MSDDIYTAIPPYSQSIPDYKTFTVSSAYGNEYTIVSNETETIDKTIDINDNKITVFVSKEFRNLELYLNAIDNIRVITKEEYLNDDIDYVFGCPNYDNIITPKRGIIIKGKAFGLDVKDFTLESKYIYEKQSYYFLRRNNVEPIFNDISFVVQGVDSSSTYLLMSILFIFGKIVVSTWSLYDIEEVKKTLNDNGKCNNKNMFFQIYTTLNGLQKVKTKKAVKVRADEIYADLTQYLLILDETKKFVVLNTKFRKKEQVPYSFCDHIIGGYVNELEIMFKGALSYIDNGLVKNSIFTQSEWSREQTLSLGYLSNIYPINTLTTYKSSVIMNTHFECVPLTNFKHFKLYTTRLFGKKSEKVEVNNKNAPLHCLEYIRPVKI